METLVNEESLNSIVYKSPWIPALWYRTLYGDSFQGYEGDNEEELRPPLVYSLYEAPDYQARLY